MNEESFVHPYIPNSVSRIKEEMLKEIGVKDPEELYRQMIPNRLRLKEAMKLPSALRAEHDLKKHMEIYTPTPEEAKKWRDAVSGPTQQFVRSQVGDQAMDDLLAAIAAYRKTERSRDLSVFSSFINLIDRFPF
jgi:glycine dehydrogenase subunit 1